jgi:hypothetical protein
MTLPVSGAISFNAINVELGVAGTTQANINQATYRTLAGVPSGQISLSNFYGKSNRVAISSTFASNTANASLNLSGISGYVAGTSDITITINSGVYLYATSTGNYGLNLSGATAGDTVTIVNNGYIMGMGGAGVNGGAGVTSLPGGAGGPALNINIGVNPTINNTNGSAYIGGGGGAGGGFYLLSYSITNSWGGAGGAGGGSGGNCFNSTAGTANGGAGGGLGSNGANGNAVSSGGLFIVSGGGGGRVFPSTSTTLTSNGGLQAGLGGSGGATHGFINFTAGAATSIGGGPNQAGAGAGGNTAGAGGGYGASGGIGRGTGLGTTNFAGGAGGKAVNLNGRSITWVSGDTSRVYGAIS